jgi:RecB family exonuclease
MARKFVLSPTKIRTYRECPAKYRLEYIDRLGRFYHRARAGFSFGHSLHRVLETFHAEGGAQAVTADDLKQALGSAWVGSGYESAAQEQAYREEAGRILEAYHAADTAVRQEAERQAVAPPTPLFTEKTLRMDLTPEIAISGRVDRVDEHADTSLEIVDYKSGRETVVEQDVAESLALGIYQALLKHTVPDRRVRATLVALRTGARASHEQTDDERAWLLADCTETGETLRTRDWETVLPVVNEHCPYCDFLPYCTRFWKQRGDPLPGD